MKKHNIISARYVSPDDVNNVIISQDSGLEASSNIYSDVEGGMIAYLAEGGTIDPYVAPIPTKSDLIAYAADKRWQVETGGISVYGIPIPTDDRAKLLIKGKADDMADADAAPYVLSSVNAMLTGLQFKAINSAVIAHVTACFGIQSSVMAEIDSDTITTKSQIDGASWPS
tara:strand:+ start:10422 stop:10934 length:513 start_codon:yes stop_codon:yes gene_type:complete